MAIRINHEGYINEYIDFKDNGKGAKERGGFRKVQAIFKGMKSKTLYETRGPMNHTSFIEA
jgi:hypothetical protein